MKYYKNVLFDMSTYSINNIHNKYNFQDNLSKEYLNYNHIFSPNKI